MKFKKTKHDYNDETELGKSSAQGPHYRMSALNVKHSTARTRLTATRAHVLNDWIRISCCKYTQGLSNKTQRSALNLTQLILPWRQ